MLIAQHIEGLTFEQFEANWKDRDSVAMRLLVLGETAGKLSPSFQASLPEVDWRRIIKLRHVLAHHYDAADALRLWIIASERAPELQRQLPIPPVPGAAD